MNRFAVIASIVCGTLAAAACGSSSTGPKDVFSGTWVGTVEGATITVVATQSGSNFTGTGTIVEGGDTSSATFDGTSTPPNVNATATIGSTSGYTYDGTYASPTTVNGWLHLGADSGQLNFVKQ